MSTTTVADTPPVFGSRSAGSASMSSQNACPIASGVGAGADPGTWMAACAGAVIDLGILRSPAPWKVGMEGDLRDAFVRRRAW